MSAPSSQTHAQGILWVLVYLFLWVFVVVVCLQRESTTWMAIVPHPLTLFGETCAPPRPE